MKRNCSEGQNFVGVFPKGVNMKRNCSEGRNFEGVFPRGSKLKYKSQQQATGILSEAHPPLLV